MAAKMWINPRIFFGLSHMKSQFLVSVRFLFQKLISSVIVKKYLFSTFKFNTSAIFKYLLSLYYTTKYADDNMIYL